MYFEKRYVRMHRNPRFGLRDALSGLSGCRVACLLLGTLVLSSALVARDLDGAVERLKLDSTGAPTVGSPEAPVKIVMFHDYQCPYSEASHKVIQSLRRTYGDELQIIYRQNPYPSHRQGFYAAQAALAAEDFGFFEELHAKLVVNRKKIRSVDIGKFVEQISPAANDFRTALDSGVFVDLVRKDVRALKSVGASGTPFFFVNGRPLRGSQSFEELSNIIDQELSGQAGPTKWIQKVSVPVYSGEVNDTASSDVERDRFPSPGRQPVEYPPLPENATVVEKLLYAQIVELRRELRQLRRQIAELRAGDGGHHGLAPRKGKARAARKKPKSSPAIVSSVSFDDDPVLGSESAKVAIVEFSTFQCGYCRRHHERVFPAIRKKYIDTGVVRYVFRDYASREAAVSAAVAANCAALQESYWEMHKALFRKPKGLGEAYYTETADRLGLETDVFDLCLTEESHREEVRADYLAGRGLGIRVTPTFFVGRIEGGRIVQARRLAGARGVKDFDRAIEAVLKQVRTP